MLRLAHRSEPRVGEAANGDAVFVRRDEGRALFSVIDGLGHGAEAAEASAAAVDVLERWTFARPFQSLLMELHGALRKTRGAAATVCVIEGTQITGCCVGNVELRVLGASVPVVMSPGVLGARVASFRIFRATLPAGSRLVLFSDGLPATAPFEKLRALPPDELCDQLVNSYRSTEDDVSVLVCDVEV